MVGDYYQTEESVQEYIQLAKDVNGAILIEKLKDHLPSGSKVLELGSGPGTDYSLLNGYYNTTGSDNSEEFLKHLKKKNLSGTFLNLDAVTLKTDQKFDGIYSNKVMIHLKDDELTKSVKRQSEILNGNGIICHSFWRGEGSEIFKSLFVNYHDKSSLKSLFEVYFDILIIDSYTEFDKDDSLILIAKKK